jgi:hypothetical protein
MSDRPNTGGVGHRSAAEIMADEPKIDLNGETHALALLLLSPSTLGRAYTRQNPELIAKALAELPLSEPGKQAAQKLMDALKVDLAFVKAIADNLKGAYAGSEPHPDGAMAKAIIDKLKEIK